MLVQKPLSGTNDVTGDDVALDTPVNVEDDVDGVEEIVIVMIWVSDVGEGVA